MRFAKWQKMHEGCMNMAGAGEASGRLEKFRRGAFYIDPFTSFSFCFIMYVVYIHMGMDGDRKNIDLVFVIDLHVFDTPE
jgi:hypothetical protein